MEKLASYATWKAKPPLTWLQQRQRELRLVPRWKWVAVLAVIVLITAMRWQSTAKRGENVFLTLLPVPIFLYIGWTYLTIGSILKPSEELVELGKSRTGKRHFVKVTVLKDDFPIGQDEGLVSFNGADLMFEGLLTSFHVCPNDVDAPPDKFANGPLMRAKDEQWKFGNLDGKAAWGFTLRSHPEIRLNFFPLVAKGRSSVYQPLFDWLHGESMGQGESLLPPIEPLPGYKSPIKARKKLGK